MFENGNKNEKKYRMYVVFAFVVIACGFMLSSHRIYLIICKDADILFNIHRDRENWPPIILAISCFLLLHLILYFVVGLVLP